MAYPSASQATIQSLDEVFVKYFLHSFSVIAVKTEGTTRYAPETAEEKPFPHAIPECALIQTMSD